MKAPVALSKDSPKRVETSETAGRARLSWDNHWLSLGDVSHRSLFGVGSSLVRQKVFQPAVRFYFERYFSCSGLFIEAGCGTGESSSTVSRHNRQFIGVDFSFKALEQARVTACFDVLLCGDIFSLPIRSASVDGIWNLGVMEHFEAAAVHRALVEFHRILKPGAAIILFWPAERNLSRWLFAPIEWLRTAISRRQFRFFPDEITRLDSKEQASSILKAAGFEVLKTDFSLRTMFIHMVVVGRRSPL